MHLTWNNQTKLIVLVTAVLIAMIILAYYYTMVWNKQCSTTVTEQVISENVTQSVSSTTCTYPFLGE